MKKNFLWTMAALFVSGFALTACDVSDNPNPNPVLPEDPEDLFNKTTTVFDFEDDQTPFVADSRISVGVAENADWGSKVATFKGAGNAPNGYAFAHYNFTEKVDQSAITTISFDYCFTNARSIVTIGDALARGNGSIAGCNTYKIGKTAYYTYGEKGAIFNIGSDRDRFFINGTVIDSSTKYEKLIGTPGTWANKWLKILLKVYNEDHQVEWTVMDGDEIVAQSGVTEGEGEEAVFTPGKVSYFQPDANSATQIDVWGYLKDGQYTYIDNLTITNAEDPSAKFADYTVRFVDPDGNELKEAITRNGKIGSTAWLYESDKTPLYNADKSIKYVYDSDNTKETPIAENGTVITVKYKVSEKYAYRLRLYFNDGNGANGTKIEFIDGEQFLGDKIRVYYQLGYKHPTDGKYYVTPASGGGGYQCRAYDFTGTESTNAAGTIHLMDVKYEKVDSIVFIGEFEDLNSMTLVGEVSTWIGFSNKTEEAKNHSILDGHLNGYERYSNGAAPCLTENSYFIINEVFSDGGNYQLTIWGRNGSGSVAEAPALYYIPADGGDPVKIDMEIPTLGTAVTGSIVIENVAIPAGAKLVIKNDGLASDFDFDCISICKQPAAAAE